MFKCTPFWGGGLFYIQKKYFLFCFRLEEQGTILSGILSVFMEEAFKNDPKYNDLIKSQNNISREFTRIYNICQNELSGIETRKWRDLNNCQVADDFAQDFWNFLKLIGKNKRCKLISRLWQANVVTLAQHLGNIPSLLSIFVFFFSL